MHRQQLELGHLAPQHEVAVIQFQRARNAVFVEVEREDIVRLFVFLVRLEIGNRHGPAAHVLERVDLRRLLFDRRRDRLADERGRLEDFRAVAGAVVDAGDQNGFLRAGGRENMPDMLGREQHGPGKIELCALGLRHLDRELLILGLAGVAIDILDAAVDPGGDLETVVVAVAGLERRRAHVRDAGGPFLRLQLGDLAEVLHIAFAGGAGEIEGDAAARLGGRLGSVGVEQLQFIDGPVRRQRGRGFGARGARSERAGREGKSSEEKAARTKAAQAEGRGSAINLGDSSI